MSLRRSVGKIIDMLEDRGLDKNTVVFFLSDHGTPYEESLRIPFIVYDPRRGARKKAVLDEMVLNIDIAPTLLDLAGVPVPEIMDGRSIVPLMYDKKTEWREKNPEEYEKISAEIRRLGVNWDQAVNDWEVRKEICRNTRYWY